MNINSMNINSGRFSTSEVADYLGVSQNELHVLYSKDQDVIRKDYHKFYDTKMKLPTGEKLSSPLGYYNSNNECVYAEFVSEKGEHFYYVKNPGQTVSSQIVADKNEIEKNKYKDCNIKAGSKVERRNPSMYSYTKEPTYDTTELKKDLPFNVKDVERVKREDNPELYDKYTGVTNPVSGHTLTCEAVYTNKPNNLKPEQEVQYVEFKDESTGERFNYTAQYDKSVDEQIAEDAELTKEKGKGEVVSNTEVNNKSPENKNENNQNNNPGVKL